MKPKFRYIVQYPAKHGRLRRTYVVANNEEGAWINFSEMRPGVARYQTTIFKDGKNI